MKKYNQFIKSLNESLENSELIGMIDYTLLKPDATEEDIIELCRKADILGVKSVCVLPKMVKTASEALKDSKVLVCTVVSFPHGTDTPEQKLTETKQVIADGADEVDMVLDYPLLNNSKTNFPHDSVSKDENNYYNKLVYDVNTLVTECHKHQNKNNEPVILKVIVESGLLDEDRTGVATFICLDAGADFIKTSTGMVAVGAELDKVQIMKDIIQDDFSKMKIKASGGIRTMADLQKFKPYVDRFGVGFAAVDSIFGGENLVSDGY